MNRAMLEAAREGLVRDKGDDRYVLVDSVGRGGMGEVWKAWDLSLRRWVAYKTLLDASSPAARSRFRREAQTLARVRHPNIATVHDTGEQNGVAFLCMEWIEGRHFDPKAPLRVGVELLRQAAEGVGEAHRLGIVHRDLKPSNILVDERGAARVVDFGLALGPGFDSRITRTGVLVGTPATMAPEQVRGQKVDARADVYAFGVMLYEMLAGHPPFEAESFTDLLRKIERNDPPPPPGPASLAAICMKALSKRPEHRYADASALAADLTNHQEGRPVTAHKPGFGYFLRRHRRAILLALALMAAPIPFALRSPAPVVVVENRTPGQARELLTDGRRILERVNRLDPAQADYAECKTSYLAEAVAKLEVAVRTAPKYEEAWLLLGEIYTRGGRHDEGVACLDHALAIAPDDQVALSTRISLLLEAYAQRRHIESGGSKPETEETLQWRRRIDADYAAQRRAIERSPAYFVYDGILAFADARYDEAVNHFEAYLEGTSSLPAQGISRWLGHSLSHIKGREEDALRAFGLAMKECPNDGQSLALRGGILESLGRHREAIEDFTRAMTCAPKNGIVIWNRGICRFNLGDVRGAVDDFDAALRITPAEADLIRDRDRAASLLK